MSKVRAISRRIDAEVRNLGARLLAPLSGGPKYAALLKDPPNTPAFRILEEFRKHPER